MVAPEPARRLDAVQFGKIEGADRLQLVCEGGLPETVGRGVEPRLVLILKVEQAVLRPAVMQARLLCLASLVPHKPPRRLQACRRPGGPAGTSVQAIVELRSLGYLRVLVGFVLGKQRRGLRVRGARVTVL